MYNYIIIIYFLLIISFKFTNKLNIFHTNHDFKYLITFEDFFLAQNLLDQIKILIIQVNYLLPIIPYYFINLIYICQYYDFFIIVFII